MTIEVTGPDGAIHEFPDETSPDVSGGTGQNYAANLAHQTVNGALQTTLIPSATNPELKSLLETGLKIFQGHQQHAEQVAAGLK